MSSRPMLFRFLEFRKCSEVNISKGKESLDLKGATASKAKSGLVLLAVVVDIASYSCMVHPLGTSCDGCVHRNAVNWLVDLVHAADC